MTYLFIWLLNIYHFCIYNNVYFKVLDFENMGVDICVNICAHMSVCVHVYTCIFV